MAMKQVFPHPAHSAVDWSTLTVSDGRKMVQVTCPWCKQSRLDDASTVSYRIRKGTYTGYCYKDRLLKKPRADRMERPDHPCVFWDETKIIQSGKQRLTRVAVICPRCSEKRWVSPGSAAASLRKGRFTGDCLKCSPRSKKREWVILGPGRKIDPARGYVRLGLEAVAPEDLHLFRAMTIFKTYLHEHRLVMARSVGRPLLSNELVDHMDGDKLNNDPINLRLYIRGRNMPGETTGYGTYYHEWQMALARIRELESSL